MPDASVVVVTHNALPWIERCLESVRGEEVVVVDNGSSDGSADVVREQLPDARVIEQENVGLAAGWNRGMEAASGRYFLILNSDAWLTDGSLRRLVAFADQRPDAAIVGPRLLNPDGSLQRSVRGFPTLWRLATEYFFLRKLAPRSQALNAFYAGGFDHQEVREAEFLMGACMLVRREAVEQVGPLDEAFFLFSEETDWAYRFREAGWKVVFFPGAECVHVGGASHGGRMFRENVRGHLRFLAKHRGDAYAERARKLLRAATGLRGRALPRRPRPDVPRDRGLARVGADAGAARPMTLVQLVFANVVLLLPGALVARALGQRSVSATLAWSLALIFGALVVTFAVGSSLSLTLVLAARRRPRLAPVRAHVRRGRSGSRGAAGSSRPGAVLGLLLWHVAGNIGGDGLFHLARVQKLDAFGSLSLGAVNEFADGGLHPGYAFPLWHGFLALVARVGFLDPAEVVLHEATVLAPVALLVAYEAGWALFRRVGPAVAVVLGAVAVTALAPDHGGAYTALGLPATASRQILLPAALALALAYVETAGPRPARVGRRCGARAGGRPPDLRDLPLAPVRGLPPRSLARRAARGAADRHRARRAGRPGGGRISRGCSRSSATRARTRPAWTSCSARSGSTPVSSTSSPTRATGWRPRCSAAPERSPWRRSCSSRSPASRSGAAGRPTSSAASSPSPR